MARTRAALRDFQAAGQEPGVTAEVLGAILGMTPRQQAPQEMQRHQKTVRVAERIAFILAPLKFKAQLTQLLFAAAASWGCLINGRTPGAR